MTPFLLLAIGLDHVMLESGPELVAVRHYLPVQIAICVAAPLLASRAPIFRHRPAIIAVASVFAISWCAGRILASMGAFDGPFFSLAYLIPTAILVLPLGPSARWLSTVACVAAFLVALFLDQPGRLTHPYAHIAWLHLGFIVVATPILGHWIFRGSRERFALERALRRERRTLALDNADLAAEASSHAERVISLSDRLENVRESERLEVARALHDDLGQLLVVAKAELGSLERSLREVEEGAPFERLRGIVGELEQSARGLVEGLREDAPPFEVALEDLVEVYRAAEGTAISLSTQCAEIEPSRDVREVILRIVQESLTNIVRHAGATRAAVRVGARGDSLWVEVEDDGRGFDEEAASGTAGRRGFGLAGMRERVLAVGGRLELSRGAMGGALVRAQVHANAEAQ